MNEGCAIEASLDDCESALAAALFYAVRLGWPILPIHSVDVEGRCSCPLGAACDPMRRGKHPRIEHGFKSATTDVAQIREWWLRWPSAQIAVATGAANLLVVDLDVAADAEGRIQKDGRLAFESVCDGRPHGCDLIAVTPRGGLHYVYAAPYLPRPSSAGLGSDNSGIDVRASNGYLIVPSPASPKRKWVEGELRQSSQLAPPPPWLVEWIDRELAPRARAEGGAGSAQTPRDRIRSEVSSALFSIQPSVNRPDWLKAIFAVHAVCEGAPWGGDLVEAWSSLTTKAGQYRHGEARDIYCDALSPDRASPGERQLVDRGTLFAMARECGWRAAGVSGDDEPEFILGSVARPSASLGRQNILKAGDVQNVEDAPPLHQAPPDKLGNPGSRIQIKSWQDVADLPPLDEQVEGLLATQSLAILAGDQESGKSTVAIDLALHMVHGLTWLGRRTLPGSVLYLAGEGHAGLAGRLRAWRAFHRDVVEADATHGRYFYIADGIPGVTKDHREVLPSLVQQVMAALGHPPSLIVIDTLSQALDDADENAGDVVGGVLRTLSDVRKRFACSVLLIHHLTKPPKGSPNLWDINQIRGSGKLKGDPDACIGLRHDSLDHSRQLEVWKLKDLEKGRPLGFRLLPVETGRTRENGNKETACIIAPAQETAPHGSKEAAAQKLRATEDEGVERVVEAIRREGFITSRDAVAISAGLRTVRGRAYLDMAIRRGLVVDVGTNRKPCFKLAGNVEEASLPEPSDERTEPQDEEPETAEIGHEIPSRKRGARGSTPPGTGRDGRRPPAPRSKPSRDGSGRKRTEVDGKQTRKKKKKKKPCRQKQRDLKPASTSGESQGGDA